MSKNIVVVLIIIAVIFGLYKLLSTPPKNPVSHDLDLSSSVPTAASTVIPVVTTTATTAASPSVNVTPTILPNGLKIEDLTVGSGPAVKSGDTVSVNYIGTLADGTKFDSSYDRGQPFATQIGVGQVIQGWDLGIVGMKVGGKRRLTIPPELGYGSQAAGTIPPNSTLIFEVELMGIK